MTAFFTEGTRSYLPTSDMTAAQGFAVAIDPAGPPNGVRIAANTGTDFIGIVTKVGQQWDAAPVVAVQTYPRVVGVQTTGTAWAVADAAIAQGDAVTVATGGKIRTAIATEKVIGYAEAAAAAADDSFPLRIQSRGEAV